MEALCSRISHGFFDQSCLAYTGFGGNQFRLPAALSDSRQRVTQRGELGIAANE
jgi:hypothetical protein